MKVSKQLSNGQAKTYTYDTIKGVPIAQYMAAKKRASYQPRKRMREYQKWPTSIKERIFWLRSIGIALHKIPKIIAHDEQSVIRIGRSSVHQLLSDPREIKLYTSSSNRGVDGSF